MKKTDWQADREAFRREWNTAAKWNMKYRPNDEETNEFYSDLMPKKEKPKMEETGEPKKRIHIRHKHKRVCPDAEQHRKDRRDASSSALNLGGGSKMETTSSSPPSVERDDANSNNNNNNSKKKSSSSSANAAAPQSAPASLGSSKATVAANAVPSKSDMVTNRMVRQQPVTYLLNQRSKELVDMGLAKPPEMLLPGLHVPHVVGAGMCRMLTGGMPTHNTAHFARRPNLDHPDFTKCTIDCSFAANADTLLSTKRGKNSVNAKDISGFGVVKKVPVQSMEDAGENSRKNRPGALALTDQPSHDPLVLRQLHHSMTNRHRQHISTLPAETEFRARELHELMASVREPDSDDDDDDDDDARADASHQTKQQTTKKNLHRTHLPKSALFQGEGSIPRSQYAPRAGAAVDGGGSGSGGGGGPAPGSPSSMMSHRQQAAAEAAERAEAHKKKTQERTEKDAGRHHRRHKHDSQAHPLLLRIPVTRDAFRKKDLIKTHHEYAHTTGGKVMMRGVKTT